MRRNIILTTTWNNIFKLKCWESFFFMIFIKILLKRFPFLRLLSNATHPLLFPIYIPVSILEFATQLRLLHDLFLHTLDDKRCISAKYLAVWKYIFLACWRVCSTDCSTVILNFFFLPGFSLADICR